MKKIINLLKTNKIIYFLYSNIFNTILKFFSCFIKTDNRIILFNSFGGKRYDDSPRSIYEYMINQEKYKQYKMYWSFDTPEKFEVTGAKKIKNNSIKYFYIALKAKYWITNSGIERGLKFKKTQTIYINTWHGSAIKHIGNDENIQNCIHFKTTKPDYFYAQSQYDKEVFSKAFNIEKDKIVLSGLPRNDELKNITNEEIKLIKEKLNIPLDKKVILYVPTYREYERDKDGCVLSPPINLKYWEKELAKKYILLFRAHYEVNKVLSIKETQFLRDYSSYEKLTDLLKISDILISDYSRIIIDYSILERPIFNYIYDYDEYKEKRGLYFDIRKELPNNCLTTEEKMINRIKKIDYATENKKTKKFKDKYVEVYGNASEYIDNIIREQEEK